MNFLFAQENIKLSKDKLNTGEKNLSQVWKQVRISEKFFSSGKMGGYMLAIEGYLLGYDYNPNYPELNYKLGVSYLKSLYKTESLKYLEAAYQQNNNVTKDILWCLARSYQYNSKFDTAVFYYEAYKNSLSANELKNIEAEINERIEECELGILLMKTPVNVKISPISEINTEYPEYCPLITADESKIYFTARRPDGTGSDIDPSDGQYYEDIYMSEFKNGKWTMPKNLGRPINTRSHVATVALSPDGNSMLLYRGGDLFITYRSGDKWSIPEPMPENINTDKIENSACFSFDGKTIYFVRGKTNDPKTSNADIYVTHFINGKWSNPERLPDIINSPKDEDGVFIHPDNRTLYFSSLGHGTIGGFDIFKSTKDDEGNWTKPVNLGYPINTPDDDIYFVLSADGKTGYYSSVRIDGKGFSDIYKIEFLKSKTIFQDTEDNLIAVHDSANVQLEQKQDIQTVYLTLITGIVFDGISLEPIEARIRIFDNNTDSLILTTNSDVKDGSYIVTLPSGINYGMNVTADNYLFHSENFDLPKDEAFKRIILDIPLYQVSEGAKVILKNIFFDFNSSVLRRESLPELFRIVNFLEENKGIKIEVSGHTDDIGSHEYNKKLSENRAKAVVDFLIEQGIDKSRLQYRGASFDEPIALNESEEGRQLNRRVEFKILKN